MRLRPAVRRSRARWATVGLAEGWAEVRGELAGRAQRRVTRLAWPLVTRVTGRHLAGALERLAVVVVDIYGFTCSSRLVLLLVLGEGSLVTVSGRVGAIRSIGIAWLAPGLAVRVTAEAGVATFHQIPPGPLVSSRAAGQLPLSHECRSAEILCRTETANCH